jgi:hypothetical protein
MRTPITKNDHVVKESDVKESFAPSTAATAEKEQGVAEQIVKFIPAEVIAFYLPALAAVAGLKATDGSVTPQYTNTLWIVFVVGLIATFAYMYRGAHSDLVSHKIPNPIMRGLAKAIISTFAFAFWAIYLGGPFAGTSNASTQALNTIYGTLFILGFTLASPFIYDSLPFPNSSSDLSIVNKIDYKATKPNDLGQVNKVTVRNHTSEDIKLVKISLYWMKNSFQKALAASKKLDLAVKPSSELAIDKLDLVFMDCDSKIHYLEVETANGCILKSQPFDSTK